MRRVRFGETDPFGVTYFASYFNYFKEALDEFLRERGIKPELFYRNVQEDYAFPIVYAEGKFDAPTRYDDEINVDVFVEELKESSVTFRFEAKRKSEVVARGKISCVCVDKSWKRRKIPEEIRRVLQS
ncbi:4-hydroxybenzoyl-CoA thioesterase [Ferroglobus placidus DSM 10642]|uniref:4-hydroxybenzoyl-CoA thioesterase n=1 Tax=Ferroglobus placidus (strain DSM 10642 / AEDII12DO) TaxID=589924 RepID=D3RYQ4_FERPA|nr:thioesterase family protein [Ferroglobus placidus]ADC65617.1 4-hydroxybenzoyl-CoA thioesterase [Ferroglobus placidus DSM 10642]